MSYSSYSLGHGPHSSIFSPTNLNFLLTGLYNNLTPTLLPASVTISHSIQPLDSQGHPWSPDMFDRMHLLFTQMHFFFWQLGQGQYVTVRWEVSSLTSAVLLDTASKIYSKHHITSVCRSYLAFSPGILLKSKWYTPTVVLTLIQLGRIPILFY